MDQLLKKIGLDENEAKIYLALLALGPATVSDITKKARLTRTFGYKILEKLGWLGLVSHASGEGKVIKYVAEHPRSLWQHLKNQSNSSERRLAEMTDALPDLVALYKNADKPIIRFQEGIAGIKSIFEESLETTSDIISILDVESWNVSELWTWAKWYNRERNKQKIKERILILDTPHGRAWLKNYRSTPYTIYRWIKPEDVPKLLNFGGELNVYDAKVIMALLRPPHRLGVAVESPTLATIITALFELVWKQAEPVQFKKKTGRQNKDTSIKNS